MKLPPLCLSSVATELGYRFTSGDLLTIGKTLKAAYVGVYGTAPEQHEQVVGGAVRMVNLYTGKDMALVEKAMKDHQLMVENNKAAKIGNNKTAMIGKTLDQYWT